MTTLALTVMVSGYLYWTTSQYLRAEAHQFVTDRVMAIRVKQDNLPELKHLVEIEWPGRLSEHFFTQVEDTNGKIIAQTPEVTSANAEKLRSLQGRLFPAMKTAHFSENDTFLVTTVRLRSGTKVNLALDLTRDKNLLLRYRLQMILALIFAFGFSLLVGRYVARSALAPLTKIAQLAERIKFEHLSERIPAHELPNELVPISEHFNAMLERLEAGINRLGRFSSDIAHELRTPINNIRMEIELTLSRPRAPDDYHNVLGSISEETERLTRLINTLLFIAKAENPAHQIERKPTDVLSEINKVIDFYEVSLKEGEIEAQIISLESVKISADSVLFERAISNLISNSINHCEPGARIVVRIETSGKFAEIKVSDTGTGIAEKDLPHIFDRLFRADESRQLNEKSGVGLGLTIVKTIARLHGGDITASSVFGEGTTMILRWPLAHLEASESLTSS